MEDSDRLEIKKILHEELKETVHDTVKEVVHEELQEWKPAQKKWGDYWQLLFACAAVIAWAVTVEARLDAHIEKNWHDGMNSTRTDIAEIKVEVRHLRADIEDLQTEFSQLKKKLTE